MNTATPKKIDWFNMNVVALQGSIKYKRHETTRKNRLYACAVLRHPDIGIEIMFHELGEAIDISEQYADKEATLNDMRAYIRFLDLVKFKSNAAMLLKIILHRETLQHKNIVRFLQAMTSHDFQDHRNKIGADILRDMFYDLTKPVPRIVPLINPTIKAIAQDIYENKMFSELPVLADALEDAGFDDPVILAEMRQDKYRFRGYWPLDLILGKR